MLIFISSEDLTNLKQTILIFGGIAVAIIMLFQLSKLSFLNTSDASDIFLVVTGVLFILVGYFINRFLQIKRSPSFIKASSSQLNGKSDLSKQEHKVLMLMADGLSNIEIAKSLFISENTVKTHVSRVLGKLNAKRRTEAVKIGRDLEII